MSAEITGGEVSDYKGYDLVMDADLPTPKVFLADRGYDADRIRDDINARGGTPVIPRRKNRKTEIPVDSYIYALRNRIERCFNKLKTHDAWQPGTTNPLAATSHSYTSPPYGSGSNTLSTGPGLS